MDIVLEVADYLFFDYLYAALLPGNPIWPAKAFPTAQARIPTSTFSSIREGATPIQYHAASQYLQLGYTPYSELSAWPRSNVYRQALSLYLITWLFGLAVYFIFATLSYLFVFDHATFTHPKYLKNQVRLEIRQAMTSMPGMALLTMPFFLAEVQGYAKLYDSPSDAPFRIWNALQFPFFILFTDFFIYWIHRGLHHPRIYKTLHKPHHKWIMPTPFASHAFHAVDGAPAWCPSVLVPATFELPVLLLTTLFQGWAQSLPYHIFPFIFPLQKVAYVVLFIAINIWTILIHDGEYVYNSPIINGAACHTMHHLYFNYNYGQFTTLWDRMGGSYRPPNQELFSKEAKMSSKEWQRQAKEMETLQKDVEGEDDRHYGVEAARVQKKTL